MAITPGDGFETRSVGTVSLDQWIALNDEMLALVHAGVPLDRGLVQAGREMSGPSRALATNLGNRMARGESLEQALDAEGHHLPELYRAVISAGVQSGRLANALEGMATFARGVAETRRAIGLALFYPMVVMTIAYGFFVGFVLVILPRFVDAFELFRLHIPRSVRWMSWLNENALFWVPIFPILLLVFGVAWTMSNRASRIRPSRLNGLLGWVPGLGSILRNAQAATVADVLALLVQEGIPLTRALPLAGRASGDSRTEREADELAAAIVRGESFPADFFTRPGAFPPLLRWVLATAPQRSDLPAAMRNAGRTYRARAVRKAESIRALLPATMLLGLGALAVLFYAMAVFGPMASLWYELGSPDVSIN